MVVADFPPGVLIMGFEQAEYTVDEEEGQVMVCVTLSAVIQRNVVVRLSTIATTAGQHYTAFWQVKYY